MSQVSPNNDGNIVLTEEVIDRDGDHIFLEYVKLTKIDGAPAPNETPSWLTYSTSQELDGGTMRRTVDVIIAASALSSSEYTFELGARDAQSDVIVHEICLTVGGLPDTHWIVARNVGSNDEIWVLERESGTLTEPSNSDVHFDAAPIDLAFDPDSLYLYLCHWNHEGVFRYDFNEDLSSITNKETPLYSPGSDRFVGVEVLANGDVIAVSRDTGQIHKFQNDGTAIDASWGSVSGGPSIEATIIRASEQDDSIILCGHSDWIVDRFDADGNRQDTATLNSGRRMAANASEILVIDDNDGMRVLDTSSMAVVHTYSSFTLADLAQRAMWVDPYETVNGNAIFYVRSDELGAKYYENDVDGSQPAVIEDFPAAPNRMVGFRL